MTEVQLPARLDQTHAARSREFLARYPLRRAVHRGRAGLLVRVRLTSYRSLPLSCIESITLAIDGEVVDPSGITLLLGSQEFRLDELAGRSDVWWFILDYADLFVPRAQPVAAGSHEIEGSIVTVEPYMTAGRFSFHNASKVTVPLEESLA